MENKYKFDKDKPRLDLVPLSCLTVQRIKGNEEKVEIELEEVP